MRYFLKLAYNGKKFHGWQSQPNASSVQETIERALSIIFRKPSPIVGAGRTDTGVHAREMYAHFDIDNAIKDKERTINSLNSLLPKEIVIYDIIPVTDDAHARFDATERTYKYFVSYIRSPFLYPYEWFTPRPLNIEAMNEAAKLLLDTSDFTSFAKLHSDSKTNICDVRKAVWEPSFDDMFVNGDKPKGAVFTISADRFLRNMVRAIVGTLVDVGRGKMSTADFRTVIENKDRCTAGTSMPATGLFLWEIKYPYLGN